MGARPCPAEQHDGRDRPRFDPSNSQRIFAVLWDHHRNNGARTYGGIGSGLFRSDDGGDTWTPLTDGLPTTSTGALAVNPDDHSVWLGTGD